VWTWPTFSARLNSAKQFVLVKVEVGPTSAREEQGRVPMPWFRWVRGVVVLGLAGALVGVIPDGVSAVAARARCRPTAFVTNIGSGTVSTIDMKTRTKNPTDITVGPFPAGLAFSPDGKTVFVGLGNSNSVSTIDVKSRTKHPTDITVGSNPAAMAVTPDGKTVFVVNGSGDSVSTIDSKTRTKNPTDITVGTRPVAVTVTPCRR
jgi:YVTN family beta-propeller protein